MKLLFRWRFSFLLILFVLFFSLRLLTKSHPPNDSLESLRERARAALSVTNGEVRLAGLLAPVEVLRDRWGVPHIYARNQHDLFFTQGYVAAQDRLFQMELWKRAGQGRLSEVAGESFLPRDRTARLLHYRGPKDAEYLSYAADTGEILGAFTDGINSYIEQRSAAGGPGLPIEFQLAGFAPERWKPEDCLTRMATLSVTGNAADELANAELVTLLGAKIATALGEFDPPTQLEPAAELDLSGISSELIPGMSGTDSHIEFPANPGSGTREMGGSNNWTVSGKMTRSGKPLLANDPHRTIALPSLRYIVHLVAPGWDVIGATEPALPGVSIGHNQNVAWGLTVFPVDQQDFYLEELNPKDELEYRTEKGWEKMRVEKEIFHVRA
ncbi:MAG: penicillin acylase family protein, partial [Candidatus Acidiferrales bacterium]